MQNRFAAVVLACLSFTPAHAEQGTASWYGLESCHHRHPCRTASGAVFNPFGMTAAHRHLRLGTRVRVTDEGSGRSVVVTITDRGPAARTRRVIDLSLGAAIALFGSDGHGHPERGLARVRVDPLN